MRRDTLSSLSTAVVGAALVSLLGACSSEPSSVERVSSAVNPGDDPPCPSCVFTEDGAIRGKLKVSPEFGASRFPILWLRAIYWDAGEVQGTEPIDIGEGTPGQQIDHTVGITSSFDAIHLQWKDAQHVVEVSADGLLFDY